jgi:hypothetical protein
MSDPKRQVYQQLLASDRGRYSGIPLPTENIRELLQTVEAMKYNLEMLLRQRGELQDSALRVADLAEYDASLQMTLDSLDARITALEP